VRHVGPIGHSWHSACLPAHDEPPPGAGAAPSYIVIGRRRRRGRRLPMARPGPAS